MRNIKKGVFSHIEGEFNDGDFNLRINVYVHLAKSADPGQAPQLRYNVGPGYALFAFLMSRYILRSDAISRAPLNANSSFPHYFINL